MEAEATVGDKKEEEKTETVSPPEPTTEASGEKTADPEKEEVVTPTETKKEETTNKPETSNEAAAVEPEASTESPSKPAESQDKKEEVKDVS